MRTESSSSDAAPRLLPGLQSIAEHYDAFLLDQYGVLHNGTELYPGVDACLEHLRAAGKRVLVLTNSGKRAEPNQARLTALGIAPALYDAIISSGELVRNYLTENADDLRTVTKQPAPLRCFLMGAATLPSLLDGLHVEPAAELADADLILLASLGEPVPPIDAFDDLFREAAIHHLTLLCANPDIHGISADGLRIAPGSLAHRYAEFGGPVVYVGKPHDYVYRCALKVLHPLPARRVLAVGDSLAHDVTGARRCGLDTLLILHGLHKEQLQHSDKAEALASLTEAHGVAPDYLLDSLRW